MQKLMNVVEKAGMKKNDAKKKQWLKQTCKAKQLKDCLTKF